MKTLLAMILSLIFPTLVYAGANPVQVRLDGTGELVWRLPVNCSGDGLGSFPFKPNRDNPGLNEVTYELVPNDDQHLTWSLKSTDLASSWTTTIAANLDGTDHSLSVTFGRPGGDTYSSSMGSQDDDLVLAGTASGSKFYVECYFGK